MTKSRTREILKAAKDGYRLPPEVAAELCRAHLRLIEGMEHCYTEHPEREAQCGRCAMYAGITEHANL